MAYIGDGSAVGFGVEVTRNTGVSRTHWFRLVSFTGGRKIESSPRAVLAESTGNLLPRRKFKKSDRSKGQLVIELTYEGWGLIWAYALHKDFTTAGTGPYTHTGLLGKDYAKSLTMEVIHGDGDAVVYVGVVFSKLVLDVQPGMPVKATIDWIAYSSAGMVSAGTPAFGTSVEANGGEAGTIGWNSLTPACRSMRWTIDHKLTDRQLLGAYTTALPKPSGRPEVAVDVEAEYESDDFRAAHLAGTGADLEVEFTNDTTTITLTAEDAYLDDHAIDLNTVSVLPEKLRFLALSNGTTGGLSVVLVNSQASAVAA
jgi:hypothetical protein